MPKKEECYIKDRLKIWNLLWNYRKTMGIILATVFISSAVQLFNPWVMKIIVDDAIPNQKVSLLIWCILGLVSLPLIVTYLDFLQKYNKTLLGNWITDYLTNQLMTKLLSVLPKDLAEFTLGDLSGRVIRTCREIGEIYISWRVVPAISSVINGIGITVIVFVLNPLLAFTSIAIVPIFLLSGYNFIYRFRDTQKRYSSKRAEYESFITESISGMKTVQMYAQEKQIKRKVSSLNQEFREIRQEIEKKISFSFSFFVSLQNSLCIGILFAVGAWLIFQKQLSLGELIAFTVYVPQLYQAFDSLMDFYLETVRIRPEKERYEDLMNLSSSNIDETGAKPYRDPVGKIEFQHVHFSYQDDRYVLQDVSFMIKPGQVVGIVGPSGSGKSTLLDLLLRFYKPRTGNILLDDKPIESYQVSSVRRRIGLVSQDIFLWNRSIRDNLLFVAPDKTEPELWDVLKVAQLEELVKGLPKGMETEIGDRGVRLSGGERQRLGIARTLLIEPEILLLDEPTSALDANTEAKLQKFLESVYQKKTVIIVAHRLTTVQKADQILVMENGALIEKGTHDELLQEGGLYQELFSKQMRELKAVSKIEM